MNTRVVTRATNTGIGRLNLLKFKGHADNDGKINLPTMMGIHRFAYTGTDSFAEAPIQCNDPRRGESHRQ